MISRPFGGPADLPALHAVARAATAADKPLSFVHVGDVTWGLYQHEPELARPKRVQIFERDGAPVAFGILWLPQTLHCAVAPEHRDDEVYDALLEWFAGAAGEELDGGLDVQLLESDVVFGAALARHGYAPNPEAAVFEHRVRSLAEPVEVSPLPDGYALRHVGPEDVERRVEVHRAAFHPSKVTVPGYRALQQVPPYRADLDDENGIGELEPVGTHPGHQRLGLGKAVCLEACRRLRELGADTAIVYSVAGYHAGRLYAAAGFEQLDRHIELRRST